MFEKLLASAIPMLLQKVAAIPVKDKQTIAAAIGDLCIAYATDDRLAFDECLESTTLSVDWKVKLSAALWDDENQT